MMAVALFNRQLPAVPRALMEKYGNVIGFCSETAKSLIQQSANRNPARAMLNNICSVNAGNNPQFNKIRELSAFLGLAYAAYTELYNINTSNVWQEITGKLENLLEGISCELIFSNNELSTMMLRSQEEANLANNAINMADFDLCTAQKYINEYIGKTNNFSNTNYTNNYNYANRATSNLNKFANNNNQAGPVCRFDRVANNNNNNDSDYINQPTRTRFDRSEIFDTQQVVEEKPKINSDSLVKPVDATGNAILVRFEDWKPTPNNPYLTLISAFDIREFELIKGVVYERIKKGQKMDRSQHTISKDVSVNTTKMVSLVDNLSRKHFSATRERDVEAKKLKLKEFVSEKIIFDRSFEDAMTTLKSTIIEDNSIEPASYRRFNVYIARPYVDVVDKTNILKELSECGDYTLMAEHLSSLIDYGIETDKTDLEKIRTLIYLQAINDKLTKFVNNFLNFSIGVEASIDSFATDVNQVESHLEQHYGVVYSGAYRDFEYETIQNVLKLPLNDSTIAEVLTDESCPKVKFNYVPDRYTITFLGLLLSQLGIESLIPGKPYLITRDKTPVIYNIAASLYKDDSASAENSVYTNLIVTLDDVYLSLNKSYLGRDMYILSTFTR